MTKLIFSKRNTRLFERLICWWTNSPYSHVEIWKDDYSYTASAKHNRVRKYHKPYLNPVIWDEVEIDDIDVDSFYEQTKDDRYDWVGIVFKEVFGINLHMKRGWYCSEWCAKAMGISPSLVSPEGLFSIVNKRKQQ